MKSPLERIMEYLKGVAEQENTLKEKLENKGIKTEEKMMKYIQNQAKELCENGENSVCVDDDTVFQWARHYWLDYEETEEKEKPKKAKKVETKEKPKVENVKVVQSKNKPTKDYEQMSLFDF